MAGRGGPMKPSMKLGYEFNVEEENFIVRKYHEGLTDGDMEMELFGNTNHLWSTLDKC